MRLYTFGNYYLSSIQQGIQGLHITSELFVKYVVGVWPPNLTASAVQLIEWARNHKTVVCLNGGNSKDLRYLFEQLDILDCPYPYAFFCEDHDSLDGVYTCVGVVLPEWLYERPERKDYQTEEIWRHEWQIWVDRFKPKEFDLWMVETLNRSSLAR